MSEELDDVLNEFIIETHENLDSLDRDLINLEQDATPDVLASVFRAIHTIKGTAGFFGFEQLESVAHVGENLLSRLRDGELPVTQRGVSALLSMVDSIRNIMASIEQSGAEGDGDYSELIAELERLERGEIDDESALAVDAGEADPADVEPDVELEAELETGTDEAVDTADELGTDAAPDVEPQTAAPTPEPAIEPTPEPTPEPVVEAAPTAPVAASEPAPDHAAPPAESSAASSAHAGGESIRVDVGLLDDLMNLVGELVLARNQILQYTGTQSDSTFNATTQRLNLITTELQEGVMRTRMQPIENVWNKFPRVVRDLSVACNKQASLVMEGKHTELDKTLLEAIKDPLTHLVRNSVDHGLETPDQRAAAGKPAEGVVKLRAYHEGGQVIIEISDDGHGIDPAVIRRKAVEKGVMTADEAASRSDREIVNVIFQAGFSTAPAVTNISGRGVGMDVVRTNIESIGGSIDVQSVVGVGTTFKVKIPLTLAIIPALVVTCDDERFAIPQVSLLELVRIDGHDPQSSIELVHGVPVYRLRGRLLPIVYLHEVFGKEAPPATDGVNIVVLQADDREFGLVVDEISDTAEIVVKPLGRILKHVSAFAGATIMGDGRVALILDVLGIAEHVGMASSRDHRHQNANGDTDAGSSGEMQRILMFRLGEQRLALLLEMVARLEEFTSEQIEVTSRGKVVQYRGEILNLVYLSDELGIPSSRPDDQPVQAIVYTHGDRSVGVVVDDIFDVVEERLEIQHGSATTGMLGSAVVQGRVTEILDVEGVLRRALPGLFSEEAA